VRLHKRAELHLLVIPGVSSYAASKIANARLVEYAGHEIEGLHVVNLQPKFIETDLNSRIAVDTSTGPLSLNLLESIVSFKIEVIVIRRDLLLV
jgi:NAD(P)-dependent dehydrogenase (short-subunit alcohol dehydrogenase family)